MVEQMREGVCAQSEFLADCPAENIDTAELVDGCFVEHCVPVRPDCEQEAP